MSRKLGEVCNTALSHWQYLLSRCTMRALVPSSKLLQHQCNVHGGCAATSGDAGGHCLCKGLIMRLKSKWVI